MSGFDRANAKLPDRCVLSRKDEERSERAKLYVKFLDERTEVKPAIRVDYLCIVACI